MTNANRTRQGSWGSKTAILVSETGGDLYLILREMMQSYNWKLAKHTDSLEEAFEGLQEGRANFLLFNESESLSAPLLLKRQMQHKVASLTPTLILCTNANTAYDIAAMEGVLASQVLTKPISHKRFLPALHRLLTLWSTPPYLEVRRIATELTIDHQRSAISGLARLASDPRMTGIASPCLAKILWEHGDLKATEKLLLNAIKNSPKDLGVITCLTAFYFRIAMPQLALRFLNEIKKGYETPRLIFCDLIQGHLMLNQIQEIIPILRDMIRQEYLAEHARAFLTRALFTTGRAIEFEAMLKGNRASVIKFTQAWSREPKAAEPKAAEPKATEPKAG